MSSLEMLQLLGPEIGRFIVCACLNHINKASSIPECAANRNPFRMGLKLVISDASRIFSLFFMTKITVLLVPPNSSAIADLDLLLLSTLFSLVATARFRRHCLRTVKPRGQNTLSIFTCMSSL